jgi:hypothetical protein
MIRCKVEHNRSNSWWLNDARGIPLCRVCDSCYDRVIDSYPPEVTGRSGCYEDVVEEPIEESDW